MIFSSKMKFSKKSYAFKARYLKSNVSSEQAIYIFEKYRISAFTGKKINIFYQKLTILRKFEIWNKSEFLNEKVKILKNSECMRKCALWGPILKKCFNFWFYAIQWERVAREFGSYRWKGLAQYNTGPESENALDTYCPSKSALNA